jgi:hypothetical protein
VLSQPTERLREAVRAHELDETRFWSHLVSLSADIENNTQLVERVLAKTIDNGQPPHAMVVRLAGRVADVEAAVRRMEPDLVDRLSAQVEPVAARWQAFGPALLHVIARLTDPRLIVPAAGVILVPPTSDGAAVAHLPYNTVRIEAPEPDRTGPLPEVVRLAWLIAQLNVDLPIFSETILRDRLPLVAAAAMLPASLDAAAELRLVDDDPSLVPCAIDRWHVTGPADVDLADVVTTWWQSHLDMRPRWNVSLAALDRMIHAAVA